MISKSTNQQIMEEARRYMTSNHLSQDGFSEHVRKMTGQAFSVAYLNDMLKGNLTTGTKDTPIQDKYFLRVADAINLKVRRSFRQHHDTVNYQMCMNTFEDARETCMPFAIDGATGDGKSYTAQEYTRQNPKSTYIVRCDGDLTAKSFFIELAHSLQMTHDGAIYNIRKNVIQKLSNEDNALLIIDEAENLKDRAWESLKRIMDDLKGKCGIVFIGANSFQAQLERKAAKLKGCFPQVCRRIREGGFTTLFSMTLEDVTDIAAQYKITKPILVKALFDTCRNMGELTSMIERVLRESDSTNKTVEDLIELYCNLQRRMRAAA
jgi:DNA transposition AAA+ family ATPase